MSSLISFNLESYKIKGISFLKDCKQMGKQAYSFLEKNAHTIYKIAMFLMKGFKSFKVCGVSLDKIFHIDFSKQEKHKHKHKHKHVHQNVNNGLVIYLVDNTKKTNSRRNSESDKNKYLAIIEKKESDILVTSSLNRGKVKKIDSSNTNEISL
jgi:hypothetical protein